MKWRETFPATAWTVRVLRRRAVKITIAAILLAVLTSWATLYGYAWYARNTARQILGRLQSLDRGEPFSKAEAVISEFGFRVADYTPCDWEACTYIVRYREGWADRLIGERHWLRYVGLRPFWFGASISRVGDRIGRRSFWLYVELEPGYWGAVDIHTVSPEAWRELVQDYEKHGGVVSERYHIGWSHLHVGWETGEVVRTTLSPSAIAADKAWAYDLELGCLTRFGGCGHICQFAPLAWGLRTRHLQRPEGPLIPPECAGFVPQ